MNKSTETEFGEIDRQFAAFIARFSREEPELVARAASLLSRSVRQGHICLNLHEDPITTEDGDPASVCRRLQTSPAFGSPKTSTPIVVAGGKLFLRRYWDYEQALASAIVERARQNGSRANAATDQPAAIAGALQNRFTIISGGPGTGKTTTVLQILIEFLRAPSGNGLRIALVAPTGKAAARLEELLRQVQEDPRIEPQVREGMPRSASTIHRLLKWKPDSVFFRHNARNPLSLDLLVVDEASMVPLPLMAKLFEALPPRTRVILLGDRDQLASVEPGAVLADMAEAAAAPGSPLAGSLFVLSKNYRFGNENAIYRLSQAIRSGDATEATELLTTGTGPITSAPLPDKSQLEHALESVADRYTASLATRDPTEALAAFSKFRVLCALRRGPYGSERINRAIASHIQTGGFNSPQAGIYQGMPLLITQNDYGAKLFNGDIGIILRDPVATDPQLWAWFVDPDNQARRISPARLPAHELAYATTVHKAQGSEFESVLLVLPDTDSPIVTRELLYTGVTRAAQQVTVWYNPDLLQDFVGRTAQRSSGLRDALLATA